MDVPVGSLGRVRHLFSAEVSHSRPVQLASLLQHPAAQLLKQQQLATIPSPEDFSLISALPQLISVRLWRKHEDEHAAASSGDSADGTVAPHRATSAWAAAQSSIKPRCSLCRSNRIASTDCIWNAACLARILTALDRVFVSLGLTQLQLLTLLFLFAAHVPADAVRRGSAALQQLLMQPVSFDELPPLVPSAPALTSAAPLVLA